MRRKEEDKETESPNDMSATALRGVHHKSLFFKLQMIEYYFSRSLSHGESYSNKEKLCYNRKELIENIEMGQGRKPVTSKFLTETVYHNVTELSGKETDELEDIIQEHDIRERYSNMNIIPCPKNNHLTHEHVELPWTTHVFFNDQNNGHEPSLVLGESVYIHKGDFWK